MYGVWVNVKVEGIFEGYDQALLGVVSATVDLENKPPIVDKLYWSVSIIDRDPVGERVVLTVTLMPGCSSFDVCR